MHRVRQECIFLFRSQKGKTCTLGLSTSVRGASTGNHSFHVRRDFSCLSLNKIGRMILILCRMCSEIPVWSGKGAPADHYLCLKHCVIMAMLYLTEVVFLFLFFFFLPADSWTAFSFVILRCTEADLEWQYCLC